MSRPLRVVHLLQNFPPEFAGGTERHVAELVDLQRQAGLDVAVVCGSERRDPLGATATETWRGVPVARIHRRPDEAYGVAFEPPHAQAEAIAAVRAFAPDLVHLHHWFNLGDSLLQRLAPLPALASFHDAYAACPRFFLLRPDGDDCGRALPLPLERCVACIAPDDGGADLAERLVARHARFMREVERIAFALAPSRFHGERLVAAGVIPAAKLRVVPLGLPVAPAAAAHRPVAGRLRLACWGNLSRLKGVDLLLEALRALAPRGGLELHLFGEPLTAEAAELQRLAAGLPVTWHGRFDLASLAKAAPDLDLALFPSRAHESYSLVVEEAVALRLPLVVSDRGAPRERLGGGGLAIAVESAAPLVATLARLMESPAELASLRAALPAAPQLLSDHERTLRELYRAALAAPASGASR